MAHKAKSKSKTTQTKTTQAKTTKTKITQKVKESQNTNKIRNGTKDSVSYSLPEPIIQVSSDPAVKQPGQRQKLRPSQDTNTKVPLAVFHKRDKKSNVTDIIGAKALTTWKKSSGRNKSWANCKRARPSRGNLELLVQSKTVPVSFGWRFSTTITPSSFARSHGMRVNSGPKQQRTSKVRGFQDQGPEYGRRRWLRRGHSWKGLGRHQKIESYCGSDGISGWGGFLRITFNHGVVSISRHTRLAGISLSTSQLEQSENENDLHATTAGSGYLTILRLLRNDNHADVWLVQSSDDRSKFYVAHEFLNDGLSGNWPTFARRKMDRLRRSHSFYAETVQLGRKIIFMQADAKVDKNFHIKNMQLEFPPLPGTGKGSAFNTLRVLDICDADDEYLGPVRFGQFHQIAIS